MRRDQKHENNLLNTRRDNVQNFVDIGKCDRPYHLSLRGPITYHSFTCVKENVEEKTSLMFKSLQQRLIK